MTPTHIPPAMRGEGVPEWIVPVKVQVNDPMPEYWLSGLRGHEQWLVVKTGWKTVPKFMRRMKYARAATPTEITAARDGGRGDA